MGRGPYRQPNVSAHTPHAPHKNKNFLVCELDGQGWPCASVMLGQKRPVGKYGIRNRDSLPEVERALRRALPDGMAEGILLTIEFTIGFEDFGAYETWARGFRVTDQDGISAHCEHLDDALLIWQRRAIEAGGAE